MIRLPFKPDQPRVATANRERVGAPPTRHAGPLAGTLATLAMLALAGLPPLQASPPAGPEIQLSPPAVNFGRVSTSKTRSVQIKNKGNADLDIGSISLCSGTSVEFSWALPATMLAPKEKVTLQVTYTPADTGRDSGCLNVVSNDPDRQTVALSLEGRGDPATTSPPPTAGVPDIALLPAQIDFADVALGSSKTLIVEVRNSGGAILDQVILNRCVGTSAEYSWAPMSQFTVDPGTSKTVDVTYAPADLGPDVGCLEVRSNDPDENPALLTVSGVGVQSVTAGVDLDIQDFKVRKEAQIGLPHNVRIRLFVRNSGQIDEPRPATVVGTQNSLEVYRQSLMVSRRAGNSGVSRYEFPSFLPAVAGDIFWQATIQDDDPDLDLTSAVTRVIDPSATVSAGVDLDIRRFRATRKVTTGSQRPVRLRLWVENHGTVDEPRTATLIGMRDGAQVYAAALPVSDSIGDRSATRFNFPSFVPTAAGEIVWLVVVPDDDPDVDEALAVTQVSR